MNRLRTIFFGTHEFAATILEGIHSMEALDIVRVITQPDRPVGRTQELQASPVKRLAESYHISIDQPASLKNYTIDPDIYDVGIVAQYGLLIPEHILHAPTYGILNVHTSLLPKYRGASPIQTALMNGDTETGVTIMKMDKGLDTGPILLQKKVPVGPDDTYAVIDKLLAQEGIVALREAIPAYVDGSLAPIPQDNVHASICKELTRDDGRIDWTKSSSDIYNQYRALTPWPGLWTTWNGKRLKLLRLLPNEKKSSPGLVTSDGDLLTVGCGTGSIRILELQLEGKKPMTSSVFVHGYNTFHHATLS